MANNNRIENISIENAEITFRNFGGKPTEINPAGGSRDFAIVISDPDFAKSLIKEGWNVKQFKSSDNPDSEPDYYLKVKVAYKAAPPKIWLCSKSGKTLLDESSVSSLDYAEISSVDAIITPYHYNVRGQSGIAAYIKTMYVNVIEDEFADKYRYEDVEDQMPWN